MFGKFSEWIFSLYTTYVVIANHTKIIYSWAISYIKSYLYRP